jgi:hypothetical protein
LNKCEWDAYFEQAGLKTVATEHYAHAKTLIEGNALSSVPSDDTCMTKVPLTTGVNAVGQNLVATKLAENLDLLNLIVEQAKHLDPKTPGFYLCGEMISRIMERDRTLDNEKAFQDAFANMEQLALKASLADTRNLEIDGRISHDVLRSLRGAPLLSVEEGSFVFNPEVVVHSYFTVRGLNKDLVDIRTSRKSAAHSEKPVEERVWYGNPLPKTLLLDISAFKPLPRELEPITRYVACVAKKNHKYYAKADNKDEKKLVQGIIQQNPRADRRECTVGAQ